MEKAILRKGLVIGIIAIFFGLALMPSIGTANISMSKEGCRGAYGQERLKNGNDAVEIEVNEYKPDGSIETKMVLLTQEEANALKSKLIDADTLEERISLLKEYGVIPVEVTIQNLEEEMYEKAGEMGLTKEQIQKIMPQYEGTKTLMPPILLTFFNRVDAVYFLGSSLRIGLSPIIDLLYLIAGWGIKKIDFVDICWAVLGVLSTEGLLANHAFVGMPSSMCIAGFLGYSIKFPLALHIFTGYSVMTFAAGLGIHDVSFLPWIPR